MASESPVVAIARLRSAWDDEVRPSARRALWALGFAVLFGAAHLARVGSTAARAAAAGAIAAVLAGLVARALLIRRRRRDLRRTIRDTIARTDPALGAATLRALTLVERTEADDRAGSPALAGLHLSRLLGRAPVDRVSGRAAAAGSRWSTAGLALAALAAASVLVEPFRIVEGLDVLCAVKGDAPLQLPWIDGVEMAAIPPEYLHQTSSEIAPFSLTAAPRGTTITVRGRPQHPGRALLLTDGKTEVPFVDDGSGALVARWTLGDTTTLRVAAAFGEVRVPQMDEQVVNSIPDELPVVNVEKAPRTVKILDEPSVAVHYEAADDHGLREVDLVLRAGAREERRVLSRPQADATVDRGGYEIRASDPFFKRTYTPVEVTVEARDNDTVSGPKWGKSAAIIILLPQVGEPEARRFEALVGARDAVTDLLAFRLGDVPVSAEKASVAAPKTGPKPAPGAAKTSAADHRKREIEAQDKAVKAVEAALGGTYGGLSVRGRLVSLSRGQIRRLKEALDAELKGGDAALADKHQKLVDETESALLAVDVGVRMLGMRDSRAVAKRLADVADEAANAAASASGEEKPAALAPAAATPAAPAPTPSLARLDAAVEVLGGGGTQLLRLGELGQDLGEIVKNDLRRIARAREAKDLFHAELAARDLAARLREPDPSFSGGGGKGGGGVESGGAPSPGQGGESSGAADEAAQAGREMEDLARDHAEQMDEVEEALEKAASPEEIAKLKDEAKRHADAIREAVKALPQQGGDPGSAEGAAAAGREQAEAMAGALERAEMRDAVESGKKSSKSLDEARRAGEQNGGFDGNAGREAQKAREQIERELAWAEDALEKLRRASSEKAKADLDKAGKSEDRLAERAKDLGKKGETSDRALPQDMLDRLSEAEQAMREAQKALQEGDGDRGFRHQKEAQRLLEMAREQQSEDGEGEREGDREDGKKQPAKKAEIPGKDKHKGPDDFRKRVMEGLGGASDPVLREAVKRYAEGLLK